MSVFTSSDFKADVYYSDDPIPRYPELERFFTYSASDVICEPERTPRDRQIFFRFLHDGAWTDILLNPSLPMCIICALTRYLDGIIPTEGDHQEAMIHLAWSTATDAVEEAQPSDRAVRVDVYPRQDERMEEDECDPMVPAEDDRSVETLLSKIVSSVDRFETCAICLEEFGIGQEALAMPCWHVFHGGCIKVWMKQSHCCPLCRFELPTAAM